jgi:hypothetical protein
MGDLRHNSDAAAPQERGIFTSETNFGDPLEGDFERMARRRFQNPKPFREGNWWWINPWQDVVKEGRLTRKRKRMKVAPATLPDREAKKIAAEMLRPMNQGLETIGSAMLFGAYVEGTYRSAALPLLASTTRNNYEYVLSRNLLPMFGDTSMRDLSTLALQKYFSGLKESHASACKIKDVLASVMGSAVRFGIILRNPLTGVRLVPSRTGAKVKPTINPDQFGQLVDLISEPYSTMVYVCVLAGLRVWPCP